MAKVTADLAHQSLITCIAFLAMSAIKARSEGAITHGLFKLLPSLLSADLVLSVQDEVNGFRATVTISEGLALSKAIRELFLAGNKATFSGNRIDAAVFLTVFIAIEEAINTEFDVFNVSHG
jgi:hypothetical protein